MNIEDRIREIVREELDKREKPLVPKYEPPPIYNPSGSGLVELCDSIATERETRIADHIKAVLTPAAGVFGDVVNDAILNNRGSFTIKADGAVEYTAPGSSLVQLDENVPSGTAVIVNVTEALSVSRTGCACPPGTVASCPDKACPWKS